MSEQPGTGAEWSAGLARFRQGPLEWLWRSLTYWEKQPMKL